MGIGDGGRTSGWNGLDNGQGDRFVSTSTRARTSARGSTRRVRTKGVSTRRVRVRVGFIVECEFED